MNTCLHRFLWDFILGAHGWHELWGKFCPRNRSKVSNKKSQWGPVCGYGLITQCLERWDRTTSSKMALALKQARCTRLSFWAINQVGDLLWMLGLAFLSFCSISYFHCPLCLACGAAWLLALRVSLILSSHSGTSSLQPRFLSLLILPACQPCLSLFCLTRGH